MQQLIENADHVRREVFSGISRNRKSELGQFMTPMSVARYMASLFQKNNLKTCRLLDAGAGLGALTCAFLDRVEAGELKFKHLETAAYEIDDLLRSHLERTLREYSERLDLDLRVMAGDFIELAANMFKQGKGGYTHAILNPPYKKIKSDSEHRFLLRDVGIETVNLYSAFVSLAIELMAAGGQIVAIIPRSFCNGPYYKPFRELILKHTAIRHIHLFDSRNKTFKDDHVLQENIIILLERDGCQGDITISTSTDDTFADFKKNVHPFNRIVFPNDLEKFIHVPTSMDRNLIELSSEIRFTLEEIGVKVSTGPVVDFRLKEHLRAMPEPEAVPLLYPGHFKGQCVEWPKHDFKKSNAIQRNSETEKWLYPNGFYCVVRRFSSKEEAHRIVASVVQPSAFGKAEMLGFENHLNVFHENKHGLSEALAKGLSVFLNTTAVDQAFRRFNGHTQVNATDLKLMKYPSREFLVLLGEWVMQLDVDLSQAMIDSQFERLMI